MLDPRFKAAILASKCGSISDAANSLYLSKQAVKKQIDSLENELGITLFNRSSKGLELTAAGKMYIEGIEKLTNQHTELVGRCFTSEKYGNQQTLTILQPNHPRLYFKKVLMEYNELYPNVILRVIDTRRVFVLYNNTARLRTLIDGVVDVVFAPHENKYEKTLLSYVKLCDLPYCCVLKRSHPLAARKRITREDLANYAVRINTVIDRVVYEHIINQDVPFLPEQIVYAENEPFSVPEVVSFCLNGGIFIIKGDYIDTLDPLIAVQFDPPFTVENGIYYRNDAPEHVKNFVELASNRPWEYSVSRDNS